MIKSLEYITGNAQYAHILLESKPIVYEKDNKPYGFVSIVNYRSGVIILSGTKDNKPFLREMIVYIRRVASVCPVYILHNKDRKDISDNIMRVFGKKFKARQLVTDNGILTIGRKRYGSC